MRADRCIQWMHYERAIGFYWVRKIFNGRDKRRTFQKVFSLKKYGGKRKALEAARAWRDELEKKYKQKRGMGKTSRKKKHPAPVGVTYTDYDKIHRIRGEIYVYRYKGWQAKISVTPTKVKTASFSAKKYGYHNARLWAIWKRRQFEKKYYQ